MRDDQLEFVTVWNGVVDGADGDHLVAGRMAFKRAGPPIRQNGYEDGRRAPAYRPLPQQQRTLNAILLALRNAQAPVSAEELAFLAKVSPFTSRRVLARLEARGQVVWSRRPGEYRWVGVYTLVQAKSSEGTAA